MVEYSKVYITIIYIIQAKAACAHGEWGSWLEKNCKISKRQSYKYMQLARDMPELINESVPRGAHFDSINSAIAYLSASEEVKAQIDQSTDPVTEKQIKEWERKHRELEEEKQLLASRSQKLPMKTFFGSNARQTT
jgi:hypothetical protein